MRPSIKWHNEAKQAKLKITKFDQMLGVTVGKFGNVELVCFLDTGGVTSFPRTMDVGDKLTGDTETYQNFQYNGRVERAALPEMLIDNVSLYNVPALCFGDAAKRIPPPSDGVVEIVGGQPIPMTVPFLGADTLFPFVYEIDVKGGTLTLRDADRYPITDSRRTQGTVLPLEFTNGLHHNGVVVFGGYPLVRGTIGGVPATISIDSGNGSDEILVTKQFFNKLQRKARGAARKIKSHSVYGSVAHSGKFSWSLGSVRGGSCPVTAYTGLPNHVFGFVGRTEEDVDALIGGQLLNRYKVTIDSVHAKVLLVPHRASGNVSAN